MFLNRFILLRIIRSDKDSKNFIFCPKYAKNVWNIEKNVVQ